MSNRASSGVRPLSRMVVWRWFVAAVWLVYLVGPVRTLAESATGWPRVAGLAATVVFIALYLEDLRTNHGFSHRPADANTTVRWCYLLGMLVCVAATVPGAGSESLTFLVFVAAAAMGTLVLPHSVAFVAALFAFTEISGRFVPGWSADGNGFAIFLASLAVFAFRMAYLRQQQLLSAERELADHALVEQRSRIAQDLHDILGHSLTVVSVKAELAERMLDVDPDRARAELKDLGRLTRDALADVRSTTAGLRGVSLAGEVASARDALESAGIEARLPTVTDDIPSRWRELFAWVVREGVTNVVRHSDATWCDVSLGPDHVSVTDDGVGAGATPPSGHGLDGLRQRARLAGARFTSGPGADGEGFRITVQVLK